MVKKYKFGNTSRQHLATIHPDLQKLAKIVLDLGLFDFGISCGHRGQEAQNALYFEGRSKLKWPNSKHNKRPAEAFDFVLYTNGKVDWNNLNAWYMAVGVFRGVAATIGIKIRTGADWDSDFTTKDQSFHDLPHIEIILDE